MLTCANLSLAFMLVPPAQISSFSFKKNDRFVKSYKKFGEPLER